MGKTSTDEVRRFEFALKPAEGPVIEEVLEHVSNHGVLHGPVDWVFKAWIIYVEHATQRIAEAFQLTEEERRQLFHFRDTLKRLLLEARGQAKAKLTSIYNAIIEDTYRIEGNKLYAPDGTWMYVREGFAQHIIIHGVSASARFPDILRLSREKLELLQLGWRASDEYDEYGRPGMETTQPWQVFAWVATRYGELYAYVASVILTREGVSVPIRIKAKSWRQKWSKDEAISLVADNLRRGEWTPMLTMWLGDGKARWRRIGRLEVAIAAKEPWRLGLVASTYEAIVAKGRGAFVKLMEAAGIYGELLELLRTHKWNYIKQSVQKKKKGIDIFREKYGEASTLEEEEIRMGDVVILGIAMNLQLVHGNGGSLIARYSTRDVGKALAIAERLESAGLRPNIVRSNANYVVYIATADLLKLAERDGEIRRAIALYLAEKAKDGTPRQREIAEKILKRRPIFSLSGQR
jgi:hypothetical protein